MNKLIVFLKVFLTGHSSLRKLFNRIDSEVMQEVN